MIIGITGTIGAGKGTVAELLRKKGFLHYSARGFIAEEISKRGLVLNRESLVHVGNELRQKNSPSYIAEKLFEKAISSGKNSIIESIRTTGEIEALRKKSNFILVAVDASPAIRYQRILKRNSETDNIGFEQFLRDEQIEMSSQDPNKQNLDACIKIADVKIINNGSLEELEKDVEELIDTLGLKKEESSHEQEKKINLKIRTSKREGYLHWDDYFMGVALLSAKRSKDPNTQTGACIVNKDNKIIGIGYNGFPIGCSDDEFPWAREGTPLETKYFHVCHAELNAILNSPYSSLKNCKIYTNLFPCNECAKAIIQSGIKKVIYLSDKYAETDSIKASKKMFESANVEFSQHSPETNSLNIDFSSEKV